MPGFNEHNCGRGCACNKCSGCIRAGNRCKIFPAQPSLAELAEVAEPVDDPLGPEELVTINVSDLTWPRWRR